MILAPYYIDIIFSPGYLLELGQITFFKFQEELLISLKLVKSLWQKSPWKVLIISGEGKTISGGAKCPLERPKNPCSCNNLGIVLKSKFET